MIFCLFFLSVAKVYGIYTLICTECGFDMRIMAFITEPEQIERILNHLVKHGIDEAGFSLFHFFLIFCFTGGSLSVYEMSSWIFDFICRVCEDSFVRITASFLEAIQLL